MFKIFKKKSPEEAIREDLSKIEIGNKAINLGEFLTKYDRDIMLETLQSEIDKGRLKGRLVGRKGWFLPNADNFLDQTWSKLLKGAIDLERISKDWGGLGNKRVYLALEEFAKEKQQSEPIFTRSGDTLYLNSFLTQQLVNSINYYNFDEGISLEKIMDNVSLPPDNKELFEKHVRGLMLEKKFDYRLGGDNMIRRVNDLQESVNEYILEEFESNNQIMYEDIGEKFGIDREEVSKIILALIEKKELDNITNYPLDEKIVKK